MKLMVSGSRTITDTGFVYDILDLIHKVFGVDLLIHGDADGVDTIAENWAIENGIITKPYPADWKRFGRSAGILRNSDMVNDCDKGTVIWDCKSRGTYDSLKKLYEAKKLLGVYTVE